MSFDIEIFYSKLLKLIYSTFQAKNGISHKNEEWKDVQSADGSGQFFKSLVTINKE